MRDYTSGTWGFSLIWGLRASVFPKAVALALPNAGITFLICNMRAGTLRDIERDGVKDAFSLLSFFTSVLFFVLYFRSNVAYSRWWEGGTLLQQIRGEWFNAYSSIIAFSATDPKMAGKVEEFHHTLARYMSLLFSSALQQVSPNKKKVFEIIDTRGVDPISLKFLEETGDKVEVILQWIQRSIILNMASGVLPIPPPVMSRAFQELSRGCVNLQNARKIAEFPFPFPYAQTSVVMLLIHWALCPLMCSFLLDTYVAVCVAFGATFFLWCINYIALALESPFGDYDNDLPMDQMQMDWNQSLGTLLARRSQQPPRFDFDASLHRRLEVAMRNGKTRELEVPRVSSNGHSVGASGIFCALSPSPPSTPPPETPKSPASPTPRSASSPSTSSKTRAVDLEAKVTEALVKHCKANNAECATPPADVAGDSLQRSVGSKCGPPRLTIDAGPPKKAPIDTVIVVEVPCSLDPPEATQDGNTSDDDGLDEVTAFGHPPPLQLTSCWMSVGKMHAVPVHGGAVQLGQETEIKEPQLTLQPALEPALEARLLKMSSRDQCSEALQAGELRASDVEIELPPEQEPRCKSPHNGGETTLLADGSTVSSLSSCPNRL